MRTALYYMGLGLILVLFLNWNYSDEEINDWITFLEDNQWKIYPLLANILKVFLPNGDYQILYTLYPQGLISVIAKPL